MSWCSKVSLLHKLKAGPFNARAVLPCGVQEFSTSHAEVKEALEHVEEIEKKEQVEKLVDYKRLDRNKDGTKKLSFAIVGPSNLQEVNELLYATYHPFEPLTKHLGLYKGLNSITDVDRMVEEKLAKKLTLIAFDEEGKPVGAAVNNVCHKEELHLSLEKELEGIEDPRYRPIQAIHHTLRIQNKHVYQNMVIDKLFDIGMIGVRVDSRGQGVATNLIRRSILLAGCLGFQGIKTEATGKFSREVMERVGMLPSSSVRYDDFTYEGKKVFSGIADEEIEITFMTKKFFQSALKHIL